METTPPHMASATAPRVSKPTIPPLRILVLNERDPEHPRAGGAEVHVERIFSRLAARGHEVLWLSTGFLAAEKRTEISGIDIHRRGPLPFYYATLPLRVRRMVARGEVDVIVECLNKLPFYAPLWVDAPVLALCHHLFGGVAFDQVARPLAAAVVTAEAGVPLAYRGVPFLAISDSTAADLEARGIPRRHISVSPPGIDPGAYDVDPAATRPPRVTYVGRLERYKRVDVLLRAGARLVEAYPDLELLVIGKGAEQENLEDLARDLGLEGRARFTGFVEDRERDALLAGTRVCVFPSEKEGWGLTVIEANALGTPVVARDAPGLRDSVRHEETGLLVGSEGADDIDAWTRAIASLMDEDGSTLAMRSRCLDWAGHFDWDRAAEDMEDAIAAALASERR